MEAAGSIQHVKSHYVALPGENSRNQRNQCHHRNQRNQSVPSVLQLDGQITRGGEPCLPAIDYSDGSDYAHVNVSANGSQTHGIPPPLAGTSLQFPSTPEDLLSQRKDIQDAQDHREVAVINRNQRNQSMSATTRAGGHVEQSSLKWTDYGDYANESVSAYWFQTYKPDPPSAGASLQHLSEAGDLLTEQEDIQGAQDHRVDYAISVINRCLQRHKLAITLGSLLQNALITLITAMTHEMRNEFLKQASRQGRSGKLVLKVPGSGILDGHLL